MDCERVRDEFIERLTGTLHPHRATAIDEHIAGCAACRAETDRMREMWSELGALAVPAASGAGGRVGRLIDARKQREQTPARRLALRAALLTAVAASVSAGIVLGRRSAAIIPPSVAPEAPTVAAGPAKAKYVLLLHGPARTRALTPERAAADSTAERAIVAEYKAWAGRLAASGALVAGEKLADEPITLLAANGSSEMPRYTADELGGFFIIQAADSVEAFRIARDCPHLKHGGTVQVRRIEPT
ncbi:MAG TPA: YciI family protein [Gemmatimonadaceae bacterium]|nr:YciI family protein [Gemmatimonadaceae bacterium]